MINGSDRKRSRLHGHYRTVGLVLQTGTVMGLVLIFTGLMFFIVSGTSHISGLTPVTSLFQELLLLNPAAVVTLGLLLILIMPVFILLASLVHFIMTREIKPLIVCIVLIIMLAASYILVLK